MNQLKFDDVRRIEGNNSPDTLGSAEKEIDPA